MLSLFTSETNKISDNKRFWSKVNVESQEKCWEWQGALRNGYGAFKQNKTVLSTHRLSYEIVFGKIPNSFIVCHKCDNPKCVNPNHLFLGTHVDNTKDAINKQRHFIPTNGKKFAVGNTPLNKILDDSLVSEINNFIEENPDIPIRSICELFDVDYRRLIDRRSYLRKLASKQVTT